MLVLLGKCLLSIQSGGGLFPKSCLILATPWTVARQAPLSMGFPRQGNWSGLPFHSPEDLPNPGIKPGSPALQVDSLPTQLPGGPFTVYSSVQWVLSGLISEHLQPPSFSGAAQTSSAGQLALTWGPWEVIPVSAPPASSFSTDPEGTLRKQPV